MLYYDVFRLWKIIQMMMMMLKILGMIKKKLMQVMIIYVHDNICTFGIFISLLSRAKVVDLLVIVVRDYTQYSACSIAKRLICLKKLEKFYHGKQYTWYVLSVMLCSAIKLKYQKVPNFIP